MINIDFKTREGKQLFYQSKFWSFIRKTKIEKDPLCEICFENGRLVPATEVHHITDIDDCPTWENATNMDGLQSLCKKCHSKITAERTGKRHKKYKEQKFNLKEFKKYLGV